MKWPPSSLMLIRVPTKGSSIGCSPRRIMVSVGATLARSRRFGESNGFEYDEPRRNAWPYRDWLISALNRDLPFDEFARQQLAGDVLAPGDPDALTATGFLVAGAYDTAGQNQQTPR